MERLLTYLYAIAGLSKDIHYNYTGENFYSVHLLMDRIYDGLYDFADDIQENYFMYGGQNAISARALFYGSAELLADKTTTANLSELIKDTIYICEEVSKEKTLDCGDNDLLGRISSKLKKDYALLIRSLS